MGSLLCTVGCWQALSSTHQVQAAVTPQAVTPKMCQNTANVPGGRATLPTRAENYDPRARHRADAAKYPMGTQLSQCCSGGWRTCWKRKERTSTSSYLHGLVKFVGEEERLVLDTLNCRKRRGMQGTWSGELCPDSGWGFLLSPPLLPRPPSPPPVIANPRVILRAWHTHSPS